MPNAGAHIEFKGYEDLPISCPSSSLRLEYGTIKVPTGPGIGVDIYPDYGKSLLLSKMYDIHVTPEN